MSKPAAAIRSVLVGALLWGCAAAGDNTDPSGTGGNIDTGRAGSGGSSTSAGSGGSTGGSQGTSSGTGGAVATGGSSSSGPSGGGSSGTASGGESGSAGASGGSTGGTDDAAPPSTGSDAAPSVDPPAAGGSICPKCKSIFDGKTLDGWQQDPAGSFVVKDGVIASTGKGAHAWTKEDYGDFRMFLTVRQIKGNHKPCTTLWGTRPAGGTAARGLKGIQFQPPLGGSWDYRSNTDPKGKPQWMYPNPRPTFDVLKWHRCEILAHVSKGEFRAACCEIEGKDTCKGVEVLHYVDPTNKKGPFALMMHNAGLFDEYKDIMVEVDPVGDELLSTK
jgi:hypothetical protein